MNASKKPNFKVDGGNDITKMTIQPATHDYNIKTYPAADWVSGPNFGTSQKMGWSLPIVHDADRKINKA